MNFRTLALCTVVSSLFWLDIASPQVLPRLGEARELAPNEAQQVLGLTEGFVTRLVNEKDKLSEDNLQRFKKQFGLLPNGLPTFQIGPENYFVLIPLSDMERQPSEESAQAGPEELPDRTAFWAGETVCEPRPSRRILPGCQLIRRLFCLESRPERCCVPCPSQTQNLRDSALPKTEQALPPARRIVTPPVVDHTGLQSPVRNQGRRGACVAFAACAELESLLIRNGAKPHDADLSENLA
jgi:hypothetical protein